MKLFRATITMERDEEIHISDILVMAEDEKRAKKLLEKELKESWENYKIMAIGEVEQKEKVLGVVLTQ
jgi:hypothetical protein